MLSYFVYFEIETPKMVTMCIFVEYMCVCVKFGRKSAIGYRNFGKTA